MKDQWLIDLLESNKDVHTRLRTPAADEETKLLSEYAELRSQIQKTKEMPWDNEEYWQGLESKIMANIEQVDLQKENVSWMDAHKKSKKWLSRSTFAVFFVMLFGALLSGGANETKSFVSLPNFTGEIASDCTQKFEDSQFVLSHQDSGDFLIDVAARRTDSIEKQIVQ